MSLKRALIASFFTHVLIFCCLASGFTWNFQKIREQPIEAHLVMKDKNREKDLLPKKKKQTESDTIAPEKAPPEALEKANTAPKKPDLAAKNSSKTPEVTDNMRKLAALSQSFLQDLSKEDEPDPEDIASNDNSYFDQIYTLIKESFVLPPHIDGPSGRSLKAVLRIFLVADGSLLKVDLESSSTDEHFDKAVMDGTKRVNNFGPVPIFLQNMLRERGIVVELCPFKCGER